MAHARIDISALTPAEKLELLERLWDSLGQNLELTPSQRAELADRVAALDRGEMNAIPLEQAVAAIRAGRAKRQA